MMHLCRSCSGMPWQQTRCGSLWPVQLCCQLQRAQTLTSWNRSVVCTTPGPCTCRGWQRDQHAALPPLCTLMHLGLPPSGS